MVIGGDGVTGAAALRRVMKEGKQGLNSFVQCQHHYQNVSFVANIIAPKVL